MIKPFFLLSFFITQIFFGQSGSLDLSVLKKSKEYYNTTTFLSKKECIIYKPGKSSKSFFGSYYFIEKKSTKLIDAITLTVQDSIKPWRYNNKTEQFVELTCNDIHLNIVKNINLNNGITELELKLGKPLIIIADKYFVYKKDTYFYSFLIENKKITRYRIGVYNSDTLNETLNKHLSSF